MKRVLFILTALISVICIIAQSRLYVVMNDGTAESYSVAKVDSLTFSEPKGFEVLSIDALVSELHTLRKKVDSLENALSAFKYNKNDLVGIWKQDNKYLIFNEDKTFSEYYYEDGDISQSVRIGEYKLSGDELKLSYSSYSAYECVDTLLWYYVETGNSNVPITSLSSDYLYILQDVYTKAINAPITTKEFTRYVNNLFTSKNAAEARCKKLLEYEKEQITDNSIFNFEQYGNEITLTGLKNVNTKGSISIPSAINYKGDSLAVTAIGDNAFYWCSDLTNISMPNTIKTIGEGAFMYNKGLISVSIPESVVSIGDYAFANCTNLTDIKIPNSVTSIGEGAFAECVSLEGIAIPENVLTISDDVFFDCDNLKEIYLPKDCKIMDSNGNEVDEFLNCDAKIIRYGKDETKILFSKSQTLSDTISTLTMNVNDKSLLIYVIDEKGNAISSAKLKSTNAKVAMADNGTSSDNFYLVPQGEGECSIIATLADGKTAELAVKIVKIENEKVVDADSTIFRFELNDSKNGLVVKRLKDKKTAGEIFIPAKVRYKGEVWNVTTIGDNAFFNCEYMNSIMIPNSITSIGNKAFVMCYNLTSIEIPNSVTSIGDSAFMYCSSLTSIEIPNSVISLGDYTFSWCPNLTSIEIPNSVISIGAYTFSRCPNLTSIEISNSVTSIGDWAFYHCDSLTNIKIPNSVTSIGNGAFEYCKNLTNIEISNSVTSIGNWAFEECSSLTSIEIPSSITSIGYSAFEKCFNLTSINVDEANSKYSSLDGVLFNKDKTKIIKCPEVKKGKYVIPNSVTMIVDSAFIRCDLTNIEIPNSVTSIGNGAFVMCYNLTSIEIPNSVTSIGNSAFYYCRGLTSIEIPNSVTSIGNKAFESCSNITNIKIPNSVTSIGNMAFDDCSGLTSIEIPNSVTLIDDKAFWHCYNLQKIHLPYDCKILDAYGNEVDEFLNCDAKIIRYGKDETKILFSKSQSLSDTISTLTMNANDKSPLIYVIDEKGNAISSVKYKSTNAKVAMADNYNMTEGFAIVPQGEGECSIIAFAENGKTAELAVKIESDSIVDGHGYVDLGLPSGTLWATCNVGATKPEEYGDYFAWGETKIKSSYTTYNCDWYKVDYKDLQANGVIDENGNLTTQYDAATVNWGKDWRMPTIEEIKELLTLEYQATTINGVKGMKFTGLNGNICFFPFAGLRLGDELISAEENGGCWATTVVGSFDAYFMAVTSKGSCWYDNRAYGQSIRPVVKK